MAADNKLDAPQVTTAETEEKTKKVKWVYPAVLVLLCVFFVAGLAYGLNSVLQMEGAFPPATLTEALTPAPESAEEVVAYLQKTLAKAIAEKPAFTCDESFSIDEDSITSDGSEPLNRTLQYLRSDLEDSLDASFPEKKADYGEGFEQFITPPVFTATDIESFTCDYIYYRCASCGETSDEPRESCDICGADYPYQMQYSDTYKITIELKESDGLIENDFPPRTQEQIRALFGDDAAQTLDIGSVQAHYDRIAAIFVVGRETDELRSLTYEKDMTVTADAVFRGDYAALGQISLRAAVTETNNSRFTWPSIALDAHTMTLEPGKSDNLLPTLTCDDQTAYTVKWSSSDESVVDVDNEGYLKAGKHPGTAVITASFTFNGNTYSDACEVSVLVPVESLKLSKRQLTLSVGEAAALTARVSPKKATVQTVTWYSENDAVATVDANGSVTAIAPGTVVIYALSDDGYYRSSCEVSVK